MRTRLTFLLLTGACTALLAFTSLAPRTVAGVSGSQGPGDEVAMDGDDIARRGDRAEGPGGRRVGDCRDHGPAARSSRARSSPTTAAGT